MGSKRFLTNKVDRSVGGRVAQQQCVGALQTPLADFGLMRLGGPVGEGASCSFRGAATAVGEQPFKLLVDPRRGARLTLSEALLNLAFCSITCTDCVICIESRAW